MNKKAAYYLVLSLMIFFLIFEIIYYFSEVKDFREIIALEFDIIVSLGVIAGVTWLYRKD